MSANAASQAAEQRLADRIGRAAISNATLIPLQAVLGLAAGVIVARQLGSSLYGAFAIFTALRSSLLFYTDLGSSTAGSKLFPELTAREGRRGAVRILWCYGVINFSAGALWVAGLLLAAPLVLQLFHIPFEQRYVVSYAAVSLLIEEAGRVGLIFLWAQFAQRRANWANLLGTVAQPVAIVTAVVMGASLRGILVAAVIALAIRSSLLVAAAVIELRSIPVIDAQRADGLPLLSRFVKISLSSWVEKLVGYVYGVPFITLVLAATTNRYDLAQFALAADFTVRALSLVLSPTHGIILPAVSAVFATGADAQRRRVIAAALRSLALLLLPAAAVLVGAAPALIPALYSREFQWTPVLVQILVLFQFAEYAMYSPANAVLLSSERLKRYVLLRAGPLVLMPVMLMVLPHLTIVHVAVVYGLVRLAAATVLLVGARGVQDFPLQWPFYGRLLLVALAAAVVGGTVAFALHGVLGAVTSVLAAGIAAVVGIRLLHCVDAEDMAPFARVAPVSGRWIAKVLQ